MKKYIDTSLLLLLIIFISSSNTSAKQNQKITEKPKHTTINLRNATGADTSNYSIRIIGQTNSVSVNGIAMTTTNDSTTKKNSIQVSGEGNTISVITTNNKSEVIITQKGGNNKVIISQNK